MGRSRQGREADSPTQLGRAGWKGVLRRLRTEVARDHLDMIAGGVAFYAFLALFPALAAGVSIYGLVADPREAAAQLAKLTQAAPTGVRDIVNAEMQRLAAQSSGALGFGAILTLLLTLWSANKGMQGLLTALNVAYDEEDHRGALKRKTLSLALTLAGVVSVVVLLGLLVALPPLLEKLGFAQATQLALEVLRWPVVAGWLLLCLAVLYRVGPARQSPKWRWVTPGSLLATGLGLAASAGFAVYAAKFDSFNHTYGSLGAVAILLVWLYLSAYAILVGAELNAEAEHQTTKDSTGGPTAPMGRRGAYVADTLGD